MPTAAVGAAPDALSQRVGMSPMACLQHLAQYALKGVALGQGLLHGGIGEAAREQGVGHAFDDERACGVRIQPALAGVEQSVFGQGSPGGAVGSLHVVVVNLQVRRSTSRGWPPSGMPASRWCTSASPEPAAMCVLALATVCALPLASTRASLCCWCGRRGGA